MTAGRPNDHVAAVLLFEGVFSAAECALIDQAAAALPPADVGVYPEPPVPRRMATTRVLPALAWVEERLLRWALRANEHFGFEVEAVVAPLLHVTYAPGDFFHWHTDLADGAESTRKISVSVQLAPPADYEGGALEVVSANEPIPVLGAGSATLFPSYLAHRVLPVTRGERRALVTWLHGPSFR